MPEPRVLGQRALGRALLERQLLLRRADLAPLRAVEHLAGLQSQAPNAPYVGLWTRLAGFRPAQLAALMTERAVVRGHLMRNTVHLVTAGDFLAERGLYQAAMARSFASSGFARNLAGADLAAVLAAGRALLAERPRTRAELGRLLGARWPGRDPSSLAYAVTYLVPTVQVPPRGIWGAERPGRLHHGRGLAGRPSGARPLTRPAVLRYLAAYGPATVRDAQAWCGLTRLGEVADRLRPRLRTFRDAAGARAARPARRAPAGPGHPGPAEVPARVRQRAARLRRPQPGHPRPAPGPAAPRPGRQRRYRARRRPVAGHVADHPPGRATRPWSSSRSPGCLRRRPPRWPRRAPGCWPSPRREQAARDVHLAAPT